MKNSPPLYLQERPDTCALACLRMVLAAYGTTVDEATLIGQVSIEAGGTSIEEVERLARLYGLEASITAAHVAQLRSLLQSEKLAIAYVNRRLFTRRDISNVRQSIRRALIHSVVPIRVTSRFVVFHDPLQSRPQRRSRHRFEAAHGFMGHVCVVCGRSK